MLYCIILYVCGIWLWTITVINYYLIAMDQEKKLDIGDKSVEARPYLRKWLELARSKELGNWLKEGTDEFFDELSRIGLHSDVAEKEHADVQPSTPAVVPDRKKRKAPTTPAEVYVHEARKLDEHGKDRLEFAAKRMQLLDKRSADKHDIEKIMRDDMSSAMLSAVELHCPSPGEGYPSGHHMYRVVREQFCGISKAELAEMKVSLHERFEYGSVVQHAIAHVKIWRDADMYAPEFGSIYADKARIDMLSDTLYNHFSKDRVQRRIVLEWNEVAVAASMTLNEYVARLQKGASDDCFDAVAERPIRGPDQSMVYAMKVDKKGYDESAHRAWFEAYQKQHLEMLSKLNPVDKCPGTHCRGRHLVKDCHWKTAVFKSKGSK